MLHSLWDPSSTSRDLIQALGSQTHSPNHWLTREFPYKYSYYSYNGPHQLIDPIFQVPDKEMRSQGQTKGKHIKEKWYLMNIARETIVIYFFNKYFLAVLHARHCVGCCGFRQLPQRLYDCGHDKTQTCTKIVRYNNFSVWYVFWRKFKPTRGIERGWRKEILFWIRCQAGSL